MDDFFKQYLITALWSSVDADGDPLGSNYEIADFAEESIKAAKVDCDSFQLKAGDVLTRYKQSTCGHDFWLTRNSHGAGFWDGDYQENDGEFLTSLSKEFPSVDLYVGDDNKLYFS